MLASHTEAAFGPDRPWRELGVGDGNTLQKEIPDFNMDIETQLFFNGMSTYAFLYVQSKRKTNGSTNKRINLPILQNKQFFTLLHV